MSIDSTDRSVAGKYSSTDMEDPQKSPESRPEHDDAGHESNSTEDRAVEIGGPRGLEPTRYGDWERKGRCIDF